MRDMEAETFAMNSRLAQSRCTPGCSMRGGLGWADRWASERVAREHEQRSEWRCCSVHRCSRISLSAYLSH